MTHTRLARTVACTMALCGALMLIGPVAGASASDQSIKGLIKTYSSKILESEGRLISAIGVYKTNRNPAPVVTALDDSIDVLRSLKTKISNQTAVSTRVKEGKTKLIKGLQAVIIAYGHLKVAVGEKAGAPSAAKENAEKADLAVKRGRLQLAEGLKLLK
jgi:hypothetical protein